jgi:hypothetical protein
MLHDGIARFVRKATEYALIGLAGCTLDRVAADIVPTEVLDAFRTSIDQTRQRNRTSLVELTRIIDSLAHNGVEAIAVKGPILASLSYSGLGPPTVRDLRFLIHDYDIAATLATLHDLGYEGKCPSRKFLSPLNLLCLMGGGLIR